MERQEIYRKMTKLDLHEELIVDNQILITRVVGGYLYEIQRHGADTRTATFIPIL